MSLTLRHVGAAALWKVQQRIAEHTSRQTTILTRYADRRPGYAVTG